MKFYCTVALKVTPPSCGIVPVEVPHLSSFQWKSLLIPVNLAPRSSASPASDIIPVHPSSLPLGVANVGVGVARLVVAVVNYPEAFSCLYNIFTGGSCIALYGGREGSGRSGWLTSKAA